ncbi:MAG TPA: class I SAM-dependent methyltransferase [Pseudolabrys sp.]|nr:class I SAM-dependent methyltransferase [Pseudolabrys sp.]
MGTLTLLETVRELAVSAQAMGALGAELRMRQLGLDGHEHVRPALQAVVDSLGPNLLDNVSPAQAATGIAQLTYALQEALDLIRDPERAPGWTYTDPSILQERGRGSGALATNIANYLRGRPELAQVLQRDCTFLDVGTGAAWIAIEAAKIWPSMRVVGIDILEPALALAEANVAAAGLSDRITLRLQSIAELDAEQAFDLVWLPTMFIPRPVVENAVLRIARAMKPGGIFLFGMFASGPGAQGEAVADLLTVRCGGHPWKREDIDSCLGAAGFAGEDMIQAGLTTRCMLARRI